MPGCFEKRITLVNELGIHLRVAGRLVQVANRFDCEITIEKDGVRINGKSILGILSLGAACGEEVIIRASGPQAGQALEALTELLGKAF
jgi:phosphocarrier protein HPr